MGFNRDNTSPLNLLANKSDNETYPIDSPDSHGYRYSSHEYLNLLKVNGCKCSMSRIGNSLDNYRIEHHFYFLKYEWLNRIPFEKRTPERVKAELDTYYNWFNSERIQIRKNRKFINQ